MGALEGGRSQDIVALLPVEMKVKVSCGVMLSL